MKPSIPTTPKSYRSMPVPVMLHMLHLIECETQDDVVLSGVARTLSQAIDELSALQRTARDVVCELEGPITVAIDKPGFGRRRLC
jgi:hypothetical protein